MKAWRLDGSSAQGHYGDWNWHSAVDHPELGLELELHQRHIWRWLNIQVDGGPLRDVEAYERGLDLVTRYPSDPYRTFTCQFHHRLLPCEDPTLFGMEHWISVQTHLLDCYPSISLGFRDEVPLASLWMWMPETQECLPHDSTSPSSHPPVIVAGQVRSGVSAAVLIHPLDAQDAKWHWDGSIPTQLQLFGGFMEKGVIRRARLRCLVSSSPWTDVRLLQHFQDFLQSPLPLTA